MYKNKKNIKCINNRDFLNTKTFICFNCKKLEKEGFYIHNFAGSCDAYSTKGNFYNYGFPKPHLYPSGQDESEWNWFTTDDKNLKAPYGFDTFLCIICFYNTQTFYLEEKNNSKQSIYCGFIRNKNYDKSECVQSLINLI